MWRMRNHIKGARPPVPADHDNAALPSLWLLLAGDVDVIALKFIMKSGISETRSAAGIDHNP